MTKKSESRDAKDILAGKRPMPAHSDAEKIKALANHKTEQLFNDARDAKLGREGRTVSVYDDLNDMYSKCAQALLSPNVISMYAQQKHLIALISDKKALQLRISMLKKDTEQCKQELLAIKANHEGKTGGTKDPDELMAAFPLYEYYQLWMQKFQANVMPTVAHIMELFAEAEVTYMKQQQAAASQAIEEAQDPTIVTDVEVDDHNKGTIPGLQ